MSKAPKRTRKVLGIVFFVLGAIRTFSFFILDVLDRFKSIRELLDYREKLPEFVKSVWIGPAVCLVGAAILTAPLWFRTVRKAFGDEEQEKDPKPQPAPANIKPARPELDIQIEEAQVFIENEFLNKETKTWLLGPRLLVRLHIVNKSSVQTTVKEIRVTFAPQVKTFQLVPNDTVEPIRSEVKTGLHTAIKPLEDLWVLLVNQPLSQGVGKQGWLQFEIEPTESSRVYFDRGKLTLNVVDSFLNDYSQSIELPHNQSTNLVIMVDGKAQHSRMTAA